MKTDIAFSLEGGQPLSDDDCAALRIIVARALLNSPEFQDLVQLREVTTLVFEAGDCLQPGVTVV